MGRGVTLIFSLFFLNLSLVAQVGNLRLNENIELLVLDSINADATFHTAAKPYRIDQIKGYQAIQKDLGMRVESRLSHTLFNKEWFTSEVKNRKLYFRPILTTELGPIFTQGLDYKSNREGSVQDVQFGVNVYTDIFENLTVDASFAFTNWAAPNYLQAAVDSTEVIPRWGEYKNGDRYSAAGSQFFGEISYSPTKNFNFQVGRGKHFFGDGYRSLLLSDNAPFYNYFRASVDVWRFKYIFLFAGHRDLNPAVPNEKYSRKYTATHFLSYNVTDWLNLNFFETIIQQADNTEGRIGLDVNYLNPVAFFRPIEFNSGSPDNALLGMGGKIRIMPSLQLYGQAVVDEFILREMTNNRGFWGNKYGLQAGLKWKPTNWLRGLAFRGEMNMVRPFTYTHGSSAKVYGSRHQPLAHPMGANFVEGIAILQYHRGRFGATFKYIMAQQGQDTDRNNFGSDIYLNYETRTVPEDKRIVVEGWEENDFGHELLQGLATDISFQELRFFYLINPKLNLSVELGLVFRSSTNELVTDNYTYGFFGLRTYLFNNMLDF